MARVPGGVTSKGPRGRTDPKVVLEHGAWHIQAPIYVLEALGSYGERGGGSQVPTWTDPRLSSQHALPSGLWFSLSLNLVTMRPVQLPDLSW